MLKVLKSLLLRLNSKVSDAKQKGTFKRRFLFQISNFDFVQVVLREKFHALLNRLTRLFALKDAPVDRHLSGESKTVG